MDRMRGLMERTSSKGMPFEVLGGGGECHPISKVESGAVMRPLFSGHLTRTAVPKLCTWLR